MKNIGLVINRNKERAEEALEIVRRSARRLNLNLFCSAHEEPVEGAVSLPDGDLEGAIDVLAALGGDGTMLCALRLLPHGDKPLLGVNLGNLGFLTSVPLERLEEALVAASGDGLIGDRRITLLVKHVRDGAIMAEYRALNDAVLGWGREGRVVHLRVSINGAETSDFTCDGLIAATPTGSTGHSLSAGGPILHPETRAMAICAICPHTLSHRPLVLPQEAVIEVEVCCAPQQILLSVDGQHRVPMQCRDRLLISRNARDALFMHLSDYNYFELLGRKLHWRGSALHNADREAQRGAKKRPTPFLRGSTASSSSAQA